MKKHIRMVGVDLDGTLLTTTKELTEYTRETLKKAIAQGCEVLVATGRPLTGVPQEFLNLPGVKYAVASNGTRIVNVETKEIIYESLLSVETAEQVLDIVSDYDASQEVVLDGQGYTKAECLRNVKHYWKSSGMQEYILTTRIPVEDVKAFLLGTNRPVDKVNSVFCNMDEYREAVERVKQIPGIEITGSEPNIMEVNVAGVSKGTALIKMGEILGIKREDIMACGDGMNDYIMLQEVGLGVAMGNADERLKAVADYVTDTNDNEGVAKAFEQFVIK